MSMLTSHLPISQIHILNLDKVICCWSGSVNNVLFDQFEKFRFLEIWHVFSKAAGDQSALGNQWGGSADAPIYPMILDILSSLCQQMARNPCRVWWGQSQLKGNSGGEWAVSQIHQHWSYKWFWTYLANLLLLFASLNHFLPLGLDVVMHSQWVSTLVLALTIPHQCHSDILWHD